MKNSSFRLHFKGLHAIIFARTKHRGSGGVKEQHLKTTKSAQSRCFTQNGSEGTKSCLPRLPIKSKWLVKLKWVKRQKERTFQPTSTQSGGVGYNMGRTCHQFLAMTICKASMPRFLVSTVSKDNISRPMKQNTQNSLLPRLSRSKAVALLRPSSWEQGPAEPNPLHMEGRLRKIQDNWSGITQDPFILGMVQRHLLRFNWKPLLEKSSHNCEVRVLKVQEVMMTSEINTMVSEKMIMLSPRNEWFFTYPFLIPKKNKASHFIMNLKLLNHLITCTKIKMTTLKHTRKAIFWGQWEVSLEI